MDVIDQSRLFIIIGPPRSGTSLVQELMNCFEDFCNNRESRVDGPGSASCYDDVIRSNDFTPLEKYIRDHWTKKHFVEKMPASINCLPQLRKHFPNAHYIFVERHPYNIHLSIMNMLKLRELEEQYRKTHSKIGDEIIDPSMPLEVVVAKEVLYMVKQQIANKPLFKDKYVIRHEILQKKYRGILSQIETKYGIKCNYKKATAFVSRPSYSSKENLYEIKKIQNSLVKADIAKACELWKYDYENPPSQVTYATEPTKVEIKKS